MWITVTMYEWTHMIKKGETHDTFFLNATVMTKKLHITPESGFYQRLKRDLHAKLRQPFYNSFVAMQLQAAKKLEITKCWICTHSPISHKTLPLLGIPSTLAEIEDGAHFGNISAKMVDKAISLLLFTKAPMRIPAVCINFTRIYPPELLEKGFKNTVLLRVIELLYNTSQTA